jgi:hypothetical protein
MQQVVSSVRNSICTFMLASTLLASIHVAVATRPSERASISLTGVNVFGWGFNSPDGSCSAWVGGGVRSAGEGRLIGDVPRVAVSRA